MNNAPQYLTLTPSGVFYAFSSYQPTDKQLALQAMLAVNEPVSLVVWSNQFNAVWLDEFNDKGWIEYSERPINPPNVQLDNFLQYVVASLSGSRKAAIASDAGFCLAVTGYTQDEADTLSVAAADFFEFVKRQQQRGWTFSGQGVSFFNQVNMLMPSTSFVLLWVDGTGYWLILDSEPLINNRAFVELVWGIKVAGQRFKTT